MRSTRALLVCVLLAPAGCGGAKVYPAGGKVVFKDGTPLSGGVVHCEAVEGEDKPAVRGYIGSDGAFRLGTFREDDGAPEGKYRVRIQPPEKLNSVERTRNKPTMQARFADFNTSQLEITVTSDHSKNDFTLQVEKP